MAIDMLPKIKKLKNMRLLEVSEATHQKISCFCIVFATQALPFDLFAFQVHILAIKPMKIHENVLMLERPGPNPHLRRVTMVSVYYKDSTQLPACYKQIY